jgi:hypothetical protein
MNLERKLKLDELSSDPALQDLAEQLRKAEILKDEVFAQRDDTVTWRIRYDAAMMHWARVHNRFHDELRKVLP